jgi:hypothetical protein
VTKLADMEEVEKTCKMDLPMCFEREDWEPLRPEEDPEHDARWTCVFFPSFLSRLLPY